MASRAEKAEETRARVVSAARSLFREHGFAATTVDQVASRAGVGKGTVFLHAGSKERLLVMTYQVDLGFAVDRALGSADVNAPLPRALAGIFISFFRLYEEDVALAREFIREQAFLQVQDHALRTVTTRLMVGLEMMIHARQRRGEVAGEVDAARAARTAFGLYYAILMAWLGGWLPDAETRDAELLAALELLWRGLAP